MLVVSTTKFKANQGKYLDMAKNGTELVLKSRVNGSFALIPILPKEYILAPDEELTRAITGEELLERLIPRIEKLFDK